MCFDYVSESARARVFLLLMLRGRDPFFAQLKYIACSTRWMYNRSNSREKTNTIFVLFNSFDWKIGAIEKGWAVASVDATSMKRYVCISSLENETSWKKLKILLDQYVAGNFKNTLEYIFAKIKTAGKRQVVKISSVRKIYWNQMKFKLYQILKIPPTLKLRVSYHGILFLHVMCKYRTSWWIHHCDWNMLQVQFKYLALRLGFIVNRFGVQIRCTCNRSHYLGSNEICIDGMEYKFRAAKSSGAMEQL